MTTYDIRKYSPIFKAASAAEKITKRNSLDLALNYGSYICPWTLSVSRSSQFSSSYVLGKTFYFLEQIITADKYPSIFSLQMEAIVYLLAKRNYTLMATVFNW